MIDEDSWEDLADESSDFTPPAPKLETATLSISGGSGDWKEVALRQREGLSLIHI